MAVADNRYSRFVQFAKVVLPILALALLSTLFLFSKRLDPNDAIPFAEIDVEKIAREQRLAAPKFSGVTSDGSAVSVSALSATPDQNDPRRLSAKNVKALIETTSGANYEIAADLALFDGSAETLELTGTVSITTTSGYALKTEQVTAALQETSFFAPTPVTGRAPGGIFEAGNMRLMTKDGTQVLVFKNGVKLIYEAQ
jgi:lipopolysaccharide export system protein LptC